MNQSSIARKTISDSIKTEQSKLAVLKKAKDVLDISAIPRTTKAALAQSFVSEGMGRRKAKRLAAQAVNANQNQPQAGRINKIGPYQVRNPVAKKSQYEHVNGKITTAYDNDPNQSKPIAVSSKWRQPLNVKDVLDGWDRFTIARAYPGSVESPYLNNMTVMPLPTGHFSISKGLSTMWLPDESPGVPENIGQGDYVCIFYCPSLSSFMGPGGVDNLSTSTRLSGFASVQTNSLSFSCSDGLFINSNYSLPATSFYGSDFSAFASGGFVWSGQLSSRIVAPAANLVGAAYKGTLTLAQLATGVSVGTLIQDSTVTCTGEYEQILRSSVIEPSLVKDISCVSKTTSPRFADAENESVTYIIYQTAAQSISAGTKMNYSLILHVDGNFVYYPKATDTFAFNLTPPAIKGNNVFSKPSPIVESLSDVANTTVKDAKQHKSLWSKFYDIGKSVIETNPIGKLATSVIDTFWNDDSTGTTENILNALNDTVSNSAASRSGLFSRITSGASLRSEPEVHTSIKPKDDYQYYFGQLYAVAKQFRGTTTQIQEFGPIYNWIEDTYNWYTAQPDWINVDQVQKRSASAPKRDRDADSIDSFRKPIQFN